MSIVNDKYFRDLADEVIKQMIQDFTHSYFNIFVLKNFDDLDLYTFETTLDALERGALITLYYSKDERRNLIKECVTRCKHGEVFKRVKNEWIKPNQKHMKVNGGL